MPSPASVGTKRKRTSSSAPAQHTARKRRSIISFFKNKRQRRFLLAYVPMRQKAREEDWEAANSVDWMVCDEFAKAFPTAITRAGKMSGWWGTSKATPKFCRAELKLRITIFMVGELYTTIESLEDEGVWVYHSDGPKA
ncbi:unnamed protein product [Peniophora sp. CBMAI 1063]|nr:unnamed protein product [Peniophora sp. CBMAI 1063]